MYLISLNKRVFLMTQKLFKLIKCEEDRIIK